MDAIQVERVSKRYLLGEDRPGGTLRDALSRGLRRIAGKGRRTGRSEIWSLRDVSFTLAAGDALGVIGRNGAGKSTLLKILSRITEPTGGVARTRGRVTSLLEVGTGFHPDLTGRENVYLNGAILGMSRRDTSLRFDEIVSFAGVEQFIDTPVKRYSSGMYLRLAFSVAAHLEPDIMAVDEVLAVGDAEFQAKCIGRMETAEREGRTVVFVSHNLDAISRLCPRAIWLDQGRIQAEGPASAVIDAYLATHARPGSDTAIVEDPRRMVGFRSVSVVDASGGAVEVLRSDQSFAIEVEFVVRSAVPGLDLAAYILNARGVEIVNEAWSDTARLRPSDPGEYVARLEIPPILNTGDYVIGVWLGTAYETLLQEFPARRFRIEGAPKRLKRAVVLRLPWDVRLTGADDGRVPLIREGHSDGAQPPGRG